MTLVDRRKKPRRRQPSNDRFRPQEIYQPELPQEGLQRIPGTPFFITPNEPADPMDCNRYPNSPWCGENPINLESIADIGVDLVLDECNIGIQLSPSLGFISLPPVQLVYRREGCIEPPPPPPINKRNQWQEFPAIRGNRENPNPYIGFISYWYEYEDSPVIGTREEEVNISFVRFEQGDYDRIAGRFRTNAKLTLQVNLTINETGRYVGWLNNWNQVLMQNYAQEWLQDGGTIKGDIFDNDSEWSLSGEGELILYHRITETELVAEGSQFLINAGIGKGILVRRFTRAGLDQFIVRQGANFDPISGFPLDYWSEYKSGSYQQIEGLQTYWFKPDWVPSIPPPEFRKKRKMDCCQNNDQLLRLLLKRVGNFPVSVPKSYLTVNDKEPEDKTITSLMELTGWFAERFDEVIGQFEINVEIDDADLTKEGKQKKTIRLPNLSEAIGEMFSMQFQQTVYTDLMIHMITNLLAESAQVKQIDFKNNHAIMAIAEYMGFPVKQINQKLPLTFTPGAETFEELLKETQIEVGVIDYQEKGGLSQHINTLLQAAAIIRAVHYRRAPNDQEKLKQQLREDLVGMAGNRAGNLREIIKEYMEDLQEQYDQPSTEDNNSSQ